METELIIEAKNYVVRLINGADKLKNEFADMDISNISSLIDCIEGGLWINKLLLAEGKNEKYDEYIEVVKDFNDLIENQDWKSVSDAILYGLTPILIEWDNVLDELNK